MVKFGLFVDAFLLWSICGAILRQSTAARFISGMLGVRAGGDVNWLGETGLELFALLMTEFGGELVNWKLSSMSDEVDSWLEDSEADDVGREFVLLSFFVVFRVGLDDERPEPSDVFLGRLVFLLLIAVDAIDNGLKGYGVWGKEGKEGGRISTGSVSTGGVRLWHDVIGRFGGSVREVHRAGLPVVDPATVLQT